MSIDNNPVPAPAPARNRRSEDEIRAKRRCDAIEHCLSLEESAADLTAALGKRDKTWLDAEAAKIMRDALFSANNLMRLAAETIDRLQPTTALMSCAATPGDDEMLAKVEKLGTEE